MKKIIIYISIFNLLAVNISYSATEFNKYSLINAVKENSLIKTKKYLIDDEYNLNVKDEYKNTALSYSIYNENYEISRLLLKRGADPKIKDSSGELIYCSAKNSPDYKIRKLFESYNQAKCRKGSGEKIQTINKQVAKGSGIWNWKTIGGGVAGIGAIALAGAGGGGGGSGGGSGGSGNTISPADRDYNIVGEVNPTALQDILTANYYLVNGFSSGGTPIVAANYKSYNDIRLAYSLARGLKGKIGTSVMDSYYLDKSGSGSIFTPGKKIKIAILDSGVLTSHVEFAGNITANLNGSNLAFDYCNANLGKCGGVNSYIANNPNPTTNILPANGGDSTAWHGTFVASMAGAKGEAMIGSAPEAELMPFRIVLDNGNFVSYQYIGLAFKRASDGGAAVVNASFGIPTKNLDGSHNIDAADIKSKNTLVSIFRNDNSPNKSDYIDNMVSAVREKDTIFVFSAGNDGNSQSNINTAIPLFYDEFKNGDYYKNFINVVAYDSENNTIADYSNLCGVTKNYCITAPGTNLIGTTSTDKTSENDLYKISDGTSFSAPIVSGAVAVLKGAFPYLTGADITKLIFITARDLGALGVDEVYGWGMLDLERATRPVGVALVPVDGSISSNSISLISSNIKMNSNMANSIKSQNLKFVILDSFNRTFEMNLNDYIETEKNRINTIDILNKFGKNKAISRAITSDGAINLYYNTETTSNNITQEVELSYSADSINENSYGFNFYYGNNPYNAFVENKMDFYNNFSLSNSYNYNPLNPYFKNDSNVNFAFNNTIKVNEKTNINFGVLYQNYSINYEKYYENRKKNEDLGSAFSFLTGVNYNLNNYLNTKVELGFINEYETLLGSKLNGAFKIGENNLTYIASVRNDINLFKDKLNIFGKISFGYTDTNSSENSLLKNISGLYSNSFTAGINYNFDNKIAEGKSNISLLFIQPVKITSGNIKISLPSSRDNDGNIYYNQHRINLENENDINVQLTYNYLTKNKTSFNAGILYRDYFVNEVSFLLNCMFTF